MLLKDIPKFKRPREKLLEHSATILSNEELLAILISSGYKGTNALTLSRRVLSLYPFDTLNEISPEKLIKIKGIGKAKASLLSAALEFAKRAMYPQNFTIDSPADIVRLCEGYRKRRREHLIGLYLNARKQLITQKIISIGTIDTSIAHPREVYAPALQYFAASVVVVHNHPSGSSEPSDEDIALTKRLYHAAQILGIELIDHIIISEHDYFSLKEHAVL